MLSVKRDNWIVFALVYLLVVILLIGVAVVGSRAVSASGALMEERARRKIIIDAGHGGEDGGATSCTGILESQRNLEIALRLEDLLHLLGLDTVMIRRTDISVYTSGSSIAAKKVSDLKERVRIVEATENGVLVSIHQNFFSDSRYGGAQVFYSPNEESKTLASTLQRKFESTLNPGSRRACKPADGVYLMQHITCPGVLVECGFLSNPREDALLGSAEYQKRICCVIASALSEFPGT